MKKIFIFGATLLAGCAPTSQLHLSAGRIGCPISEIVVGDVESTRHSETWSATCRGQVYFCSANDDFREVVCKPQLKPVATAPAPSASVVVPPPPLPATPPPVAAPASEQPPVPVAAPAAQSPNP